MLTQEKIEQIKKDAEEIYHIQVKATTQLAVLLNTVKINMRLAYISGATHEAEEGEKVTIEFSEWKDRNVFKHRDNKGFGVYGYLERIFTYKDLYDLFIKTHLKK